MTSFFGDMVANSSKTGLGPAAQPCCALAITLPPVRCAAAPSGGLLRSRLLETDLPLNAE